MLQVLIRSASENGPYLKLCQNILTLYQLQDNVDKTIVFIMAVAVNSPKCLPGASAIKSLLIDQCNLRLQVGNHVTVYASLCKHLK